MCIGLLTMKHLNIFHMHRWRYPTKKVNTRMILNYMIQAINRCVKEHASHVKRRCTLTVYFAVSTTYPQTSYAPNQTLQENQTVQGNQNVDRYAHKKSGNNPFRYQENLLQLTTSGKLVVRWLLSLWLFGTKGYSCRQEIFDLESVCMWVPPTKTTETTVMTSFPAPVYSTLLESNSIYSLAETLWVHYIIVSLNPPPSHFW